MSLNEKVIEAEALVAERRRELEQAQADHGSAIAAVEAAERAFDASGADADADAVLEARQVAERAALYVRRAETRAGEAEAELAGAVRAVKTAELNRIEAERARYEGTCRSVAAELRPHIEAIASLLQDVESLDVHDRALAASEDALRRELDLGTATPPRAQALVHVRTALGEFWPRPGEPGVEIPLLDPLRPRPRFAPDPEADRLRAEQHARDRAEIVQAIDAELAELTAYSQAGENAGRIATLKAQREQFVDNGAA